MNYTGVYFAANALTLAFLTTPQAQYSLKELAEEIFEGNPELKEKGKTTESVYSRIIWSAMAMMMLIGTPIAVMWALDYMFDDLN